MQCLLLRPGQASEFIAQAGASRLDVAIAPGKAGRGGGVIPCAIGSYDRGRSVQAIEQVLGPNPTLPIRGKK